VHGESTSQTGVVGTSPNGTGVLGSSLSGIGTAGFSSSATRAAVHAENQSQNSGAGPAVVAIGHLVSNRSGFGESPLQNPPAATAQPAAGSGAAASVAAGATDTKGAVHWTTGTSPTTGDQVQVTFAAPYVAAPVVVIVSLDQETQKLGLYVNSSTTSAQSFTVAAASAPRGTGVTYRFAFFAIG
jgi:hypothetical protein